MAEGIDSIEPTNPIEIVDKTIKPEPKDLNEAVDLLMKQSLPPEISTEQFTSQPTQEEIEQFERFKKEGKIGDLVVLGEKEVNGRRALEYTDPQNPDNKALLVLGAKSIALNAELPPAIEAGMNDEQFVDYMRVLVEGFESSIFGRTGNISQHYIEGLSNNILAYDGVSGETRRRVQEIVQNRLTLALADYYAEMNSPGEFFALMQVNGKDMFESFVLNMEKEGLPFRVRMAIKKIEEKNREIFRASDPDDKRKAEADIIKDIRGELEAALLAKSIKGIGVANSTEGLTDNEFLDKYAKKSYDFAIQILTITGQGTFYSGPCTQTVQTDSEGRVIYDATTKKPIPIVGGGQLIEANLLDSVFGPTGDIDMRNEKYWEAWANERQVNGVNIIPVCNGLGSASAITLFKTAFFAPENFEENNQGLARGLRYAAETRARSFAFYKGKRTLTEFIDAMETNSRYAIGGSDFYRWGQVEQGGIAQAKRFASDEPQLLNEPLPGSNKARYEDKAVPSAIGNLYKVMKGYEYLNYYATAGRSEYMRFEAKRDIFLATLEYHNSREGMELFDWLEWNDNTYLNAVRIIGATGELPKDMIQPMVQSLHISLNRAYSQAERNAGRTGIGGIIGKLIKGVAG